MSATAMSPEDWKIAVFDDARRLAIEIEDLWTDEIHPSGRRFIHDCLQNLKEAAYAGDVAQVHRIAAQCKDKIAQEIAWHRESLAAGKAHPWPKAHPWL